MKPKGGAMFARKLKFEMGIKYPTRTLKRIDVNQMKVSSTEEYFMAVMGLCMSHEAML
jgi:hypothetical protein